MQNVRIWTWQLLELAGRHINSPACVRILTRVHLVPINIDEGSGYELKKVFEVRQTYMCTYVWMFA